MGEHKDTLEAIFRPKSVAVIGASRKEGSIGRTIMRNLIVEDFAGTVYPVNPYATSVFGVRTFPSVLDIPDPVDMAVVVVPAEAVLRVVEECGQKGVKGLVIISAGFREIGGEGAIRENRLKELLQQYQMRAVGPNCMGLWNSDPDVRLNVTFSPAKMMGGDIAFVSQSGALGIAILDMAEELGLGLSYFVSMGNKVNISGNDLLIAWEDDPRVRLILMYLENFGNPRRFVELARRIGKHKPIIVVKSGRSQAGARAARSHTGALAEQDVLTEALFEQCGVIRARSIEELFEYARLFSREPPPKGNRVGIVTNSGGPGILASDALSESHMTVAPLSPETKNKLSRILPGLASTANPVDMTAGAGPNEYEKTLEAVMADPNIDAGIVIFTPPTFIQEEGVARAILKARHPEKPLLACILKSSKDSVSYRILNEARLPTYIFPESAVRALAGYAAYARWQMEERGQVREFSDFDANAVIEILGGAIRLGQEWLSPQSAVQVLRHAGFRCPRFVFVSSESEVADAFDQVGAPAVMKAVAPGLVHKSDVGGVRLGITSQEEAWQGFLKMREDVQAHGFQFEGAWIQEQVEGGRELIVGAQVDPKFGPLLMFGLGGKYVEVLRDVVFRLAPLTDTDAERMVAAIRGFPILQGVRGEKPSDIPAIVEALLRLSALVTRFPEIAEAEINPLVALEEGRGTVALDVRIRLWPRGQVPRAPAVVPEIARSTPV
ncbi:MAG: acetate--CoA ligase family protein [bacterium JZ-2024 1]